LKSQKRRQSLRFFAASLRSAQEVKKYDNHFPRERKNKKAGKRVAVPLRPAKAGKQESSGGSPSRQISFFTSAFRVALVYPNSYYLGMSSLGFQVIYHELNRRDDTYCHRVFLPDGENQFGVKSRFASRAHERLACRHPRYERKLDFRSSGAREALWSKPQPIPLETQRELRLFDIIAFSVSFEEDYFNIPKILFHSNIPPFARERDEKMPLIVAGGISVSYNPEPLADFIDVFLIGEAEFTIHQLISEYRLWKETIGANRMSAHKEELLKQLAQLDSFYVPRDYTVFYHPDGTVKAVKNKCGGDAPPRIKASTIANLDEVDTASRILTENTVFANTYLIEIARGCGRQCRFCVADYVRRPPRRRSLESTLELAKQACGITDRIGLVGASISDHLHIDEIAQSLVELGFSISCASLRADSVSTALLDALASSKQNTITIAPEVATKHLQNYINKSIEVERLHHVMNEALKRDILNFRLYFMIGVPFETATDLTSIVEMVASLRKVMVSHAKSGGRMGRITCVISPLVPKPHTPFQWLKMEDVKVTASKLTFLKRQLNQLGSVRVQSASARLASREGVLARGDRRLSAVIYDVAINGLTFKSALRKHGLDADFFTGRLRAIDEVFPWSHIDSGVNEEYLKLEYQHYLSGNLTGQCQPDICRKCGACRKLKIDY